MKQESMAEEFWVMIDVVKPASKAPCMTSLHDFFFFFFFGYEFHFMSLFEKKIFLYLMGVRVKLYILATYFESVRLWKERLRIIEAQGNFYC